MKCNACGGSLKPLKNNAALSECRRCHGLHGTIYRGEAYHLVGLGRPMLANATSEDALRYFDLTVLGSEGVDRIHGFYDARECRVVQYG